MEPKDSRCFQKRGTFVTALTPLWITWLLTRKVVNGALSVKQLDCAIGIGQKV